MISKITNLPRKNLLAPFRKETSGRPPFWFMRQAGRYLPEYKQVRSTIPNFLDMCYNPKLASEVTLQPIRRFGMGAAIIFSDILVIPDALGVNVRFEEKKGPILSPTQSLEDLKPLRFDREKLSPVYEALRLTKAALPSETTLIGFAGSPWTLACYMVQGQSDQSFGLVKNMAQEQRGFFEKLIELLISSVITHCMQQIEAGAEIIQLFDSWAGVLDGDAFARWVIEPNKIIVAALQKAYPHIPIIGFPRGAGANYIAYAKETKVDGISIDQGVSPAWARAHLQDICVVQGNLDPVLLAENKDAMLASAKEIISALATTPFIFNLGHGILPHTPVENVQALCDYLKSV